MKEKIRLLAFTVLLTIGAFILDQDDIILSPYTGKDVDNFDLLNHFNIRSNNYSTYGEFANVLFDNCWTDKHPRVLIDRYVGIRHLKFKSGSKVIVDSYATCQDEYKMNDHNVLIISDNNEKDPRNINLLDGPKSIYNKLMFHYMNYGARPIYAQRPDKAFLEIQMNENTDIEIFNQLIIEVAHQCENLDRNFPNMIPCFNVMFSMVIVPPPTISPPETSMQSN